jgi:hypothetical protein
VVIICHTAALPFPSEMPREPRPRFRYVIGRNSYSSLRSASNWLRERLDSLAGEGAVVAQAEMDEWMRDFIRCHPNPHKLDGWTGKVVIREQTVKDGHIIHVPLLVKTVCGGCVEEDISFMKKCLLGCRRPWGPV